MNIFISTTSFAVFDTKPLSLLKAKGIDFTLNPHKRKLTEDEISTILKENAYVGLIAGTEPLTREVLEQAKSLKIISRVGVGLDNVELAAAKELKIKVFNTPEVLKDAVAELTIGLILCCLRRLLSMDRNMRNKIWKKEMGLLFKGKTLGIIGLGNIGHKVAELAQHFGAKVIFCDVRDINSKEFQQVSLTELLKNSDIISIHSSTKTALISEREIAKMKEGVILINTSRGSSLDEESVYHGLQSGKISFAALDVYDGEPYTGKILSLNNVVCTPHIGSYAKEARITMEMEAVENLIQGLGV